MAKISSAEKRHLQSTKREARNRVVLGNARTAVKKARLAIANRDANAAETVRMAERALDRAATKGVIHRNNASRRKGRLYRALNRTTA